MVLMTYISHNRTTSPARSPRMFTPRSSPDDQLFLPDMDENVSRDVENNVEIVSATGKMVDFRKLSSAHIMLLLTPVVVIESGLGPKAQDPFEALGKKLSKRHSRVRHVPYLATTGLNDTHFTFARESAAIVYVTLRDININVESAKLYLDHDKRLSKAERRSASKPIVHLQFCLQHKRADSPQGKPAELIYPNDRDFDDAVELLYGV